MAKVKRLAIIGGYPPPYGGVTTHLMRLCALLDETDLDYVLYNAVSDSEEPPRVVSVFQNRNLWLLKYALTGKEPAVYLCSLRMTVWLLGAFMTRWRGKKVCVRIQSIYFVDSIRMGGFRKLLLRYTMRRLTAIVCVNQELVEAVAGLGVPSEKIYKFPGFLPPSQDDRDPKQVASEVWKFCESKTPVISANGKVDISKGEDLYGLDHLILLAERLKPDFPNIGIVVCFWDYSPEDEPYLNRMVAMAKAKGVEENVLFNTKRGLFVPVIEKSDLFVRPTNTDGDANSIREALYFGVPVIASDVVTRPEGTIEFRTRDIDDFEEKVRGLLSSPPESRRHAASEGAEILSERASAYLNLLVALEENDGNHRNSEPKPLDNMPGGRSKS